MCDLLSQQQQQQTPSTQQRTGQKLSSRQINKNQSQNHLSLMDTTTNPTHALSSTISTTSNTTTTARTISNSPEVSSNISTPSTNSNRLNLSNNVSCRSSKSRQQVQQSDLNCSLENVITTDIAPVMSSATNSANSNNNNDNSTDISGIYKPWSPKENSNVKQQQNCSSSNESLPTLNDPTVDQQYSLTKSERRSKLLNSTNDAHLLHNNQSDLKSKNDHCSVNSSRSHIHHRYPHRPRHRQQEQQQRNCLLLHHLLSNPDPRLITVDHQEKSIIPSGMIP
uniref:Uncharacterized protein n=1 Tax=Trichobilharzia regenti TaxID=157069 RepID=A0AA85JLL9_TRIRE|nr:unnamed protein product [Trichobilharzia regenti]